MSLPLPPNTTCDIFIPGNAPPSPPDSAGVSCFLRGAYDQGLEAGEDTDFTEVDAKFTHVMLIDADVNTVEDGHTATTFSTAQCSTVYVPDENGTSFFVIFVERVNFASAHDHKKLYLRRLTVTWPTDEL